MTVRLRLHHLLCMLAYVGKYYSAAVAANHDAIVRRQSMGADILVVSGPDDICAPLLGEAEPHCFRDGLVERDTRAGEVISALLATAIAPGLGLRLDPSQIAALRQAFVAGSLRSACEGCEWANLCTTVAGSGYAHTRLG